MLALLGGAQAAEFDVDMSSLAEPQIELGLGSPASASVEEIADFDINDPFVNPNDVMRGVHERRQLQAYTATRWDSYYNAVETYAKGKKTQPAVQRYCRCAGGRW